MKKKGLGLIRKREKTEVVDALMHHAANHLIITIPGVGKRDLKLSEQEVSDQKIREYYKIKIFTDKSGNIEIKLKKKEYSLHS